MMFTKILIFFISLVFISESLAHNSASEHYGPNSAACGIHGNDSVHTTQNWCTNGTLASYDVKICIWQGGTFHTSYWNTNLNCPAGTIKNDFNCSCDEPEPTTDCPDGSSFNEWGRCPDDPCPAGSWTNPEITEPYPNGSCPLDQCSDGSTANEAYGCPDENTSSASSDSNGNSSAVNTSSTGQQNSTGTASSAGDSGGSSGTGSSAGDSGGSQGSGSSSGDGGGDSGGGSGSQGSGSSSGGGSGSEGSGSSSGDGSGSDGSASSGSGTASGGQTCDSAPTCSGDEIQCAQLNQQWLARCSGPDADDVASAIAEADQNGEQLLDDVFDDHASLLEEGANDFSAVATDDLNYFGELVKDYFPQSAPCTNYVIEMPDPVGDLVITCEFFEMFKQLYAWFLSVVTLIYVWHTITQPVNK